jgi:NADH-quinone oxidoreductase subunit J
MLNIVENVLIMMSMLMSMSVIFVSNPIQSLLFLIASFALSSMLFMILGVEFVSLLIFLVYVGAIAVLFLFIIMMLNLKIVELRNYYLRYLPIGSFIIIFFFFELCLFIYIEFFYSYYNYIFFEWFEYLFLDDNIFLISMLIYTHYSIYFFCLALILLISMVGSIILVIN